MSDERAPLTRLQEWLEEKGAGGAYLTDPISIAYLTGFRAEPLERLMALCLRGGAIDLIVPAIEAEAAEAAAAEGVRVRGWRDGQDPYRLVAAALEPSPSPLAVEKDHLTLAGFGRLDATVETGRLIDTGPTLRRLRARKTAREIALLERAARITDDATGLLLAALREGITEIEAATALTEAFAAAGAEHSFPSLCQFGPNSALPHHRPSRRPLAAGELALFDFGASWQGYCADTTRVAVAGAPDERQREVHRVVLEAHDAALAEVRAGRTAGEIDEAARAVIRAAGYGDAFIHRVGHGLGLQDHEVPSLDPGSDLVLEEGMVLTIEPGIYLPGWGGVRIEDDVVVERGRGRALTAFPRHLAEVPTA
ncbi:MAG TPA: Xaa-Pro peptidase family protein [Candidatus Dormibacteraeota bacterium]|jgi:Xaa-Pro dipeptidase|nr:Xaa-Pro peptidase family protein [Candidatus Dormibacteraeota bacterium]